MPPDRTVITKTINTSSSPKGTDQRTRASVTAALRAAAAGPWVRVTTAGGGRRRQRPRPARPVVRCQWGISVRRLFVLGMKEAGINEKVVQQGGAPRPGRAAGGQSESRRPSTSARSSLPALRIQGGTPPGARRGEGVRLPGLIEVIGLPSPDVVSMKNRPRRREISPAASCVVASVTRNPRAAPRPGQQLRSPEAPRIHARLSHFLQHPRLC